ncbi:MAG: hypothetical protein J6J00_11170 [Treponema sp.]|nr:hypothetical protein [Treponema sp.]
MNNFKKATLKAVEILKNDFHILPDAAWVIALSEYTNNKNVITKSCPKSTFIDLCYNGYIKDLSYSINKELTENGRMVIEAITKLQKLNWTISSKKKFWKETFGKNYENQLEILFILKEYNLLNIR